MIAIPSAKMVRAVLMPMAAPDYAQSLRGSPHSPNHSPFALDTLAVHGQIHRVICLANHLVVLFVAEAELGRAAGVRDRTAATDLRGVHFVVLYDGT